MWGAGGDQRQGNRGTNIVNTSCCQVPGYSCPVVQGAPRWHITNFLLSSFILSTDRPSHVIKHDEPKGSHTLTYFISDPSIVLQVCTPILKDFILYYTLLIVQRYPLYVTCLTVPKLLACVVFSSPQIMCHCLLLMSTLSHHHPCCCACFT